MCGIVGYVGDSQAAPILLEGLAKLEYRGYDSAGIAVRNEETGNISIVKAKGRLKILSEKTDGGAAVPGTCGIGHTRWATHGEPSENNAHPHCTEDKSVVLVHNGIIENYQELKDKLVKSGYKFYSQTDTEINYSDTYRNPYAWYSTEDGKRILIWYEDSRSVKDKIELARMFGINSISIWRIGEITNAGADIYMDIWDTILSEK